MSRLRPAFIVFLCLCVFNFLMIGTGFCQDNWYAKADITKHKPVIKSLPEEKIPVETVKTPQGKGKGGGNKILWAILGVALVGGVAAAASGGGSSGGGDGPTPPTDTDGDVTVSW